jgi:DMSO reductase anchor subunit
MAGTATLLAHLQGPQTQAAAASSQQAADLRQAQNQGPIIFLLKWGLPLFIASAAGLGLWGFGRWLKMRTTRPRPAAASTHTASKPPRPD